MFCHVCGTKISVEAKFCHKCGTKVVYEDSADIQEKLSLSNDRSAEGTEEKFNATLSKVGLDKVHTIKAISEWAGIGVEEAEELFEKVPVLLKIDVALHEAMEMRSVFARERAEITFTDSKGRSVDIDKYEEYCRNHYRIYDKISLHIERRLKPHKYGIVEVVKSGKKQRNVGNSYFIPAPLLHHYSYT